LPLSDIGYDSLGVLKCPYNDHHHFLLKENEMSVNVPHIVVEKYIAENKEAFLRWAAAHPDIPHTRIRPPASQVPMEGLQNYMRMYYDFMMSGKSV